MANDISSETGGFVTSSEASAHERIYELATALQSRCSQVRSLTEGISLTTTQYAADENSAAWCRVDDFSSLIRSVIGEIDDMGGAIEEYAMRAANAAKRNAKSLEAA